MKPFQQTAAAKALPFSSLTGCRHSRNLTIILLLLLLPAFLPVCAQPTIQWDKTIGGEDADHLTSLQQTSDGGYILGGTSDSPVSGDKTEPRWGTCERGKYGWVCPVDYWVVKLDATGKKLWDKTIGGSNGDELRSVQQTSDGGYILGGSSDSPASGDKTEASRGNRDYWVVKLDAAGNQVWDKTIGGEDADHLTALQQTRDGGYMLGGTSHSPVSGDKTEATKGFHDYWVVRLDAAGNKLWDRTIGGTGEDNLFALQQTRDGGFILGGNSDSAISGDKTEAPKGLFYDFWVVKLDAAGKKLWDKTIGSQSSDYLTSLQQAIDGGYILGGTSDSPVSGDKTEASKGFHDYWVVRLDAAGNKVWNRTIGGSRADELASLQLTSDGGYILGGSSSSGISGDKTEANKGLCSTSSCWTDYWAVKLDAAGNKVWDKTIGSADSDPLTGSDQLTALQQTQDGGYILGGQSESGISGDKTEPRKGVCDNFPGCPDYWVVKLSPFPETRQVVSFTLISAETGLHIQQLTEGNEINLAALPGIKLNIRANTIPAMVGSVLFELSGQQQTRQLDSQEAYVLLAGTPPPGNYTLTATPYSQPDGQGEAGTPLTTHFTLFNKQVNPQLEWDKTIGGNNFDYFRSLQQTRDGGYVLGGYSNSDSSGEKSKATRGFLDYWVVKLDAAGNKQWDRTFGGSASNTLSCLQQTRDGGYMLGGYSDADITEDKSQASRGFEDYWVVKLDAAGNRQWDKTIGAGGSDRLYSLQQTSDGGYILGGQSDSFTGGEKSEDRKGDHDFWVVKLDAAGNKQWDKTLGGSHYDILASLQQTSDGGFILGGGSYSDISGDKTEASKGHLDYWIVRLDSTGNKQWDKSIGGTGEEQFSSLQQTHDGGYILGGWSTSDISGDKTEANKGSADYWVVKLDANGNKVWDKTIGAGSYERLGSLQQTKDGGYVLGGWSASDISGDKTEANKGRADYWIVKLNAEGDKQWDKTIGADDSDLLYSLQQTRDGGYILGGDSNSFVSGDKTQPNTGAWDFWVVKLGPFPTAGQQVKGFTLINTESEQPIRPLLDGDIIDLAALPKKLNSRADTHPDTVGSVLFELSGQQERTYLDNQVPYALFGDVRGDYNKWYPAPGTYTLTATPYSERYAKGEAGTPLTIRFTVVSKQAAALAARTEQGPQAAWAELAPKLALYPNPTPDGRLQVQLAGPVQGPLRYSLLSSLGSKLAEGTVNLTNAGTLLAFDFSGQLRTPGLYYFQIEETNRQHTFKLMRK